MLRGTVPTTVQLEPVRDAERGPDRSRRGRGRPVACVEERDAEVSLIACPAPPAPLDMIVALESERRRIARDLHDTVGQALAALRFAVQGAVQTSDERTSTRLHEALEGIDDAIAQVRGLTFSLRPPFLDDGGLVPAIRWLVDRQARAADLQADLRVDAQLPRLPAESEAVCYRIAQEALTNVVKHARAGRVTVDLGRADGGLRLVVTDDGCGIAAPRSLRRGRSSLTVGIAGMSERAAAVGGTLQVRSRRGAGTAIIAWLPSERAALDDPGVR